MNYQSVTYIHVLPHHCNREIFEILETVVKLSEQLKDHLGSNSGLYLHKIHSSLKLTTLICIPTSDVEIFCHQEPQYH